ncbi:MAG: NADH-quinone oxidoreductase subunit L [Bacteroidales bacterium]|nr:NADH-quinone oxidoreductase subunit L [Candidatus Sodaliphilus aphodohippi]
MPLSYSIAVIAIPLFMFFFLGLVGVKMGRKTTGVLGVCAMLVTTVLAYGVALTYFFGTGEGQIVDGVRQAVTVFNPDWLSFTKTLVVRMGIVIDPISAMMLVVVTTVSLMVHLYSMGYMSDHEGNAEKGFQRFYAELALFTFSMLGLVVATNLFQIFIFFEMVGVSSYLLIGFYYSSPAAIHASKKAFIVTRLADGFFLLGIMVLSFYTGTFDFFGSNGMVDGMDAAKSAVASAGGATFMGCSVIAWALTFIFIGGAGKSAMYPLHIWLPDAMEGPTPVSALIHAATMVVAGVFLVARLFPLYVLEQGAMEIITVVGAFTAFYAAAIACVQSDIKRALAFSTISQIAFMMTSLAVSSADGGLIQIHGGYGLGYMASMFHLFTHAMFKALLFLCAGAIIHAVHSNENSDMHGLHKYMPITSIAFLIGCLAIAGIPPFAGFWSKDEILVACYEKGLGWGIWMSMVAGLTAFYMFRIYFLIFHWKEHKVHTEHKPSDQVWTMTLPLIILATVSIVAGFVPMHDLVTWDGAALHTQLNWTVAGTSVAIACVGIGLAFVMYYKENPLPSKMKNAFSGLWTAAYHRFYMDELYQFITHKVIFQAICVPIAWFDRHIIDGFMNLLANATSQASYSIRRMQSGSVQAYVYLYFIGALLLAGVTMVFVLM